MQTQSIISYYRALPQVFIALRHLVLACNFQNLDITTGVYVIGSGRYRILFYNIIVFQPCCGSGSQRQSASKYVVGAGKSVKKRPYRSTISSFIPAEDVTSVDNIGDLMTNWVRTESNALIEAPGSISIYLRL